jgi:hypothetical protein
MTGVEAGFRHDDKVSSAFAFRNLICSHRSGFVL